jgi:hypothetical protein
MSTFPNFPHLLRNVGSAGGSKMSIIELDPYTTDIDEEEMENKGLSLYEVNIW